MADSDVLNARNGDCCTATHTPANPPTGVAPNVQAYLDSLQQSNITQGEAITELQENIPTPGETSSVTIVDNNDGTCSLTIDENTVTLAAVSDAMTSTINNVMVDVPANELRKLLFGSLTFTLACPQRVSVNTYYDITMSNTNEHPVPGQDPLTNVVRGTNRFSYIEINGAPATGPNSLTISDATAISPGTIGEITVSGNTSLNLPAGTHTIDFFVEVFRTAPSLENVLYSFSQGRMTIDKTKLICK